MGGVLLLIGVLLELTAASGAKDRFGSVATTAQVVLALGSLCALVGIGAAATVAILVAHARHRHCVEGAARRAP